MQLGHACGLRRLFDVFGRRGRAAVCDVLRHSARKQNRILKDDSEGTAKQTHVQLVVRDAVRQQFPGPRVVEAEDEARESALACAIRAEDQHVLAGLDHEVELAKQRLVAISERHAAKFEAAAEGDRSSSAIWRRLVNVEERVQAIKRLPPGDDQRQQCGDGADLSFQEGDDGVRREQIACAQLPQGNSAATYDEHQHGSDCQDGALGDAQSSLAPGHLQAGGTELLHMSAPPLELDVFGGTHLGKGSRAQRELRLCAERIKCPLPHSSARPQRHAEPLFDEHHGRHCTNKDCKEQWVEHERHTRQTQGDDGSREYLPECGVGNDVESLGVLHDRGVQLPGSAAVVERLGKGVDLLEQGASQLLASLGRDATM
jgi:hypothetical protein